MQDLGLSGRTKSVTTPSIASMPTDEALLAKEQASTYSVLVARANSLAQDRVDIGFVVKELCANIAHLECVNGKG